RWLTKAILDIRQGDAESGLKALREHDLLRTGENDEALKERMVGDWMKNPVNYRRKLMIAGTRAEVSELNGLARASRRSRGELMGEDVLLDVRPRDSEATMKKAFAVGDRIVFGLKDRHLGIGGEGVQNGCYGTIEKMQKRLVGRSAVLTVRLDDGRRMVFDTGMKMKLAPKHERQKGKLIEFARYNFIDHAYAITVHKSQGQTVENCFVLASDRMTDREWGYVALSRSKGATALYATESQMDTLAENLSRSRMKGTSLDYEVIDKKALRGADASLDVDVMIGQSRGGLRGVSRQDRSVVEQEREI
ncbi:MAG: ATP-binding domain-containing protein, partial [Betaproteobacteria bacterium]